MFIKKLKNICEYKEKNKLLICPLLLEFWNLGTLKIFFYPLRSSDWDWRKTD